MSRRRILVGAVTAVALAASARAVGLGPLTLSGLIDGPAEGFGLNLYNPYPDTRTFAVYAIAADGESPQPRVALFPAEVALGPERMRRVLVVANGLAPGETFRFRVCAQLAQPPEGLTLNARVCSKISAHRVSLPAAG